MAATNKLQRRHEKYQGNVYPAMLESLATHLGVTAESLARLNLGWAPIVQFKKGPNFQGWWTVPERDDTGKITGIGLRSQRDFKCMYPGSKHNLIYPVNPDHHAGAEAFRHGAHNWVRTMDAGVDCPVCGKPDGCLVTADDPADPKAAVCIRTPEGAEKPLKFGYLHILKDEGRIKHSASPLPPSDLPVLIVEGMTDAAAAMDLGFVAVGRFSDLGGFDTLCNLIRGRDVIVVGENDSVNPATGKRPGHEGMVACFQVVQQTAKTARMVLPPDHLKDLRKWLIAGVTQEQFLAHVDKEAREHQERLVLPDDKPLTFARAFLDDRYRMAGRYLLKRWNSTWFRYDGIKYEPIKDEIVRSPIYGWADDKYVQKQTSDGNETLEPVRCDNHFISNLTNAMTSDTLHTLVTEPRLPVWVNGSEGPGERDLIVFTNGILDVGAFLDGRPEREFLLPLTPDLFTTVALPFAFDPTAKCPLWRRVLRETIAYDSDNPRLLRQWYGYCMVPDTRHQKMMFMRGPSGAGKSVMINILRELVGEGQSVEFSFEGLTQSFTLSSWVGKLIATQGDARNINNADAMRGLELLLKITGNDPVTINRKFKDPLESHKLFARITMGANEFLNLTDHSGAMTRRLLNLEFKRSFTENGGEDQDLELKLRDEIPGIAVWALSGLAQLREQGHFTIPQTSKEARAEWRVSTSPMAAFIEECCEIESGAEIKKDEFYGAWNGWAMERGMRKVSRTKVYERLRLACTYVSSDSYMKGGHKFSVFRGLRLKPWAAKQYVGKPTN